MFCDRSPPRTVVGQGRVCNHGKHHIEIAHIEQNAETQARAISASSWFFHSVLLNVRTQQVWRNNLLGEEARRMPPSLQTQWPLGALHAGGCSVGSCGNASQVPKIVDEATAAQLSEPAATTMLWSARLVWSALFRHRWLTAELLMLEPVMSSNR